MSQHTQYVGFDVSRGVQHGNNNPDTAKGRPDGVGAHVPDLLAQDDLAQPTTP
jgi:hypothetical protein